MPSHFPKIHYGKPEASDAPRLVGCRAYPTTGQLPGATVEYCRKNRGAWCGDCKWLKF